MSPRGLLIMAAVVGCSLSSAGAEDSKATPDRTGQVLKHVVMYKFKDDQSKERVQEVVDAFSGLPQKIDAIIGYEHATNVSQEGKSEGFTHVFIVTFKDEAGRETYLKHPAHLAYVEVVKDRREKVIVFDYWVDAPKRQD